MKTFTALSRPVVNALLVMALTATLSTDGHAQLEDDKYYYGFKAGPVFSMIDDIRTTIIPETFSTSTFTAQSSMRTGLTIGAFVNYRFEDSDLAIQPFLAYTMAGGDFNYTDIQDLEYDMEFRYQYVGVGLLLKWYAVKGLGFLLGPDLGFNVANSNIVYTSNMPELGPDLQIQASLREVLKGKTDIGLLMGIGYDFEFGLTFEARYRLGFTDTIETLNNGFNFIENNNWSSALQFTLGYAIPFYGY